jgi:hypothetical protein
MIQNIDVRKFIPKHKHDHEVIDKLRELSFEQLKPIIPDLLEWLQDMNWPIGRPIADILKPFADKMTPEIIKILRTNDSMWELWVLVNLARDTTDPLLIDEIERIAKFPSRVEIEDEVDLEAISILNGDYK